MNCANCIHSSPTDAADSVRCMHPFWDTIEEPVESEMRVIDSSFAEECDSFEGKEKS